MTTKNNNQNNANESNLSVASEKKSGGASEGKAGVASGSSASVANESGASVAGNSNASAVNKGKSSVADGATAEQKRIAEEQKRKTTKQARIEGGKAGREQKKNYLKVKAFAIEREKDNYSKLMVIHEKKEWWKMVGHSAVIFHYEVSKWIGMASKLVADTDYDYRSEEGVVNIRDVYALDEKLAKVNIGLLSSNNECRVYSIGKKYTKADIEAMKKKQEMEWARVNKIIMPKEVFPELYMSLRELLNKVFFTTRTFEAYARDTVGAPAVRQAMFLLNRYSLLCNTTGISGTDFLKQVENSMDWMTAQMNGVAELKLLTVDRLYRTLRVIEKTKRIAQQCQERVA